MEFYRCAHCGNIVGMVKNSGVPVVCCGENMKKLEPGTTDASVEKHVPVFTVKDGVVSVKVGSADHPMVDKHFIEWIAVETAKGAQRKPLKAGDAPAAQFALTADDALVAVYAYCNLHGLWKAEA
ncbi:MAG: desulfoferrodoxin [Desulfovibrio sp.]|nr:desulfoferrodoxin [Desulfovibrio sp.]